jgi:hypothetical protein
MFANWPWRITIGSAEPRAADAMQVLHTCDTQMCIDRAETLVRMRSDIVEWLCMRDHAMSCVLSMTTIRRPDLI